MTSRVTRQLATACLVLAILLPVALLGRTAMARGLGDFKTFYVGGQAARQHTQPYDYPVLLRTWQKDPAHTWAGTVLPYVYPPPFTLLMMPLSMLSFRLASLLWLMIITASAIGCGFLLILLLGGTLKNPLLLLLVVAAVLDFAPGRNGLSLGQQDPLIALLALGGLWIARVRPLAGGLLLGCALVKPQTALLAVLALCASLRPRIIVGVAAALAIMGMAVAVAQLAALSPGTFGEWIAAALDLHPPRLSVLHVAQAGVAAIALLLIVARARALARTGADRSLALLCSLGILFNGIAAPALFLNLQSDVLLMLPIAVLIHWQLVPLMRTGVGWLPSALAGTVAGCVLGDALFPIVHYTGRLNALPPAAITLLLLSAVGLLYPSLRRAAAIAMGVNLLLTCTFPFQEAFFQGLASMVSLILLLLMLYGDSPEFPQLANYGGAATVQAAEEPATLARQRRGAL